ncbi:DUF1018 domain-containing protein [Synechococcales cyanobacterium C]|uniref:DUF1018 domain-containing protein n=1 Tax=Petrachloros mirabilis ULC683 TaxID=2781853 RepID=A0A8K1ZZ60_9CYAN|nr:regulatory protein GemA [Petrachloros mirabilis]NCJ06653.1 DUF1018 domain-containing protein [Petrachloros mirabilis ULC683]
MIDPQTHTQGDVLGNIGDLLREEQVIYENRQILNQAFQEIGSALRRIRDLKLYKLKPYSNFEDYCEAEFKMSRSRAYQLIDSAKVIQNVYSCRQIPANEAQTRPLAQLPPCEQKEVAMQQIPKDQRTRLLKLIHIGKKQLGLDDDTYREFLDSVTGHRSAADCTMSQLNLVLRRMESAGFKRGGGKYSPRTRDKSLKTPIDKIRAIWIDLAKQGKIKDRTEAGLRKFIKRQTGLDKIDWLLPEQSQKVIEALKIIQARETRE